MRGSVEGSWEGSDRLWRGHNQYQLIIQLAAFDPSGLYRIVGTIPPPPTAYVIWQAEATDVEGTAGAVLFMILSVDAFQFVVPILPPNDPEGPSYLDGLQGIFKGPSDA